jgi:molecular chaperone DnaJ
MADKDYYKVLGVARGATPAQVKDAYRRLAMEFHPDRNKSAGAEEKFKRISEAYAVLSDEEKRRSYDEYGSEGFSQRFSQEDIFRNADFSDFADVFRQMGFGSGSGSPFAGAFTDLFSGMRRGRGGDLLAEAELSLEEASKGAEKEVSLRRLADCPHCGGTGSADGRLQACSACGGTGQRRSIRRMGYSQFISVSACPQCRGEGRLPSEPCKQCNGFRLRIAGKGNASEEPGEPSGDLFIAIHVKPHPVFRREGADIAVESKIPFYLAALGGEIEVPTLTGKAEVKIPAGTQAGTVFRLKGKGVYDLRERRHGDELVLIAIDVPTKLSRRQKELLEELGRESGAGAKGKGFFKKLFR